jgi:hypothetical protein
LSFIDTSIASGASLEKPDNRLWPPLAYLALTLVLSWPLALHLTESIPHGEPDSWQNIWNFWWMRHSFFEQHQNPFWTELLFYPYRSTEQPLSLYFHTLQPAISLPAAMLSYLLGYALTYNLVILFGFVTAGWAMYALAYYFIQNRAAAFIAGTFYTFSVFHWHNLAQGQTSVFWLQWLPLYILLLHKAVAPLRGESRNLVYPILAALVLILTIYTDFYYTLYLLLYSAILFGWLIIVALKNRSSKLPGTPKDQPYHYKELVKRFGLILALWVLAAAPLLIGMLTHRNDPAIKYAEGIEIAILQSAALPSLFIPSRGLDRTWMPYFIGYTTLVLAALGGWRSGRRGWWWLALALGALIMTLGPYLRLEQSQSVEQAVNNLPLPYRFFTELPFVNNSRSPIRFMALAQLGLSLLAGWGLLWLIELVGRWRTRFALIGVISLTLLVFNLETNSLPLALEKLPQPALFSQIKNEPSYALLELPITGHYVEDTRRMYYQALHNHPISSGYISRKVYDYQREPASPFGYFFDIFPPKQEPIFVPEKQAIPLRLLNFYNFGYVINYRNDYKAGAEWQFGNAEKYLQELFGHSPDYQDEWLTAYHLPPDPASNKPVLWRTKGFYEAETRTNGETFRWAMSGENGSFLDLVNAEPSVSDLKFSAWSFGQEEDLQFLLDGKEIGRLHINTQPQEYTIGLKLPAGVLRLEIRSVQPARTPAELGGNPNDRRLLTFALAQVRF